MSAPRFVILRDGVTRDDVDDAMRRLRWHLVDIIPRSASNPHQIVFVTDDRKALAYHMDDDRVNARYFALVAQDDPVDHERRLRAELATMSREELASLAAAGDVRAQQLASLSPGAPSP